MNMKRILLISFISVFMMSCSENGIFVKEKRYTPLYIYYEPLPYYTAIFANNWNLAPYINYEHFINYPNDLKKYGLRSKVRSVTYSTEETKKVYEFDINGKMTCDGDYFFIYDEDGRFVGKKKCNHSQSSIDKYLEYDETGKLTRRIYSGIYSYNRFPTHYFSYYEDGTLKSIVPSEEILKNDLLCHLAEKMDFNESGEIVRMEEAKTSNYFMIPYERKHIEKGSISEYVHEKGLCTQKKEIILFEKDSVICESRFEYNNRGDIIKYHYNGGFFEEKKPGKFPWKTSLYLHHVECFITFEYDYDQYGNWTTVRVILPEDYKLIQPLLLYYKLHSGLTVPVSEVPVSEDEYAISIHRIIEYHDSGVQKEEEKQNVPKFTAIQGHGLVGKVKSVTTNKESVLIFDKIGNIIKNNNDEYKYISPDRYLVANTVGPFRIVCENNLRKEIDEKGIEGTKEYEFDNLGRVIRHKFFDGMMPVENVYIYNGDDKHPSMMVNTFSYEDGEEYHTYKYSYTDFDQKGNWTTRITRETIKSIEWESKKEKTTTNPEYIEVRAISYY